MLLAQHATGQVKNITLPSTSKSEVGDFNVTKDCCSIFIMGRGPKGGIWYAGEGEQDQNYLTQLVLQASEENSMKANYIQANHQSQWFASRNTRQKWPKSWYKYAEQERACRPKLTQLETPDFRTTKKLRSFKQANRHWFFIINVFDGPSRPTRGLIAI